ncbi:MAG TPA: SDR family NAD(P)-dependent oxidoreductase, partial [Blastocatellia bacterium]|nr:SDR family NAD(P)-dependent oxidoreductase [Blastocatellia bacterium]
IVDRFAEFVGRIRLNPPKIPYISNVTGKWITENDLSDSQYWARHLRHTVRFADGVQVLLEQDAVLLEVGPGNTLITLARQNGTARAVKALPSLSHPHQPEPDVTSLVKAASQLWLSGASVDWRAFHEGERRRRVPLPSYPFERRRYWLDRADVAPTAARGKRFDVSSWFYIQSWKRTMPPVCAPGELPAAKRNWLIFADETGLAEALRGRLVAEGRHVTLVRAATSYAELSECEYAIGPDHETDYDLLLESAGALPDVVVHLWSIFASQDDSSQDFFAESQRRGYYSLLFLSHALDRRPITDNLEILVASDGLFDVSGSEQTCPEKATLQSICKVIPQEYLNVSCRVIDVLIPGTEHDRERLACQILGEATSGDANRVVAYRGTRRLVQCFETARLEDAGPPSGLRERGVYLLTGGLGSVGLQLAEYLARSIKARLVLLGRSAFPEETDWDLWLRERGPSDPAGRKIARLREIQALGADVFVTSADTGDYRQMRSVFDTIGERFGELNGVIHLAGVTTGRSVLRPISELGREESEAQFRSKAHALYVLEKLIAGKQLDFCLLFSSNAAVLGGLGMAAYSAANAFMDAFAAARCGRNGSTWISANWDAWPYQAEPGRVLRHRSIDDYAMTADEAVKAFRLIVARSGLSHVVVSTGDLDERLSLWVRRDRLDGTEGTGDSGEIESAPSAAGEYAPPENDLQKLIAVTWQKLLGIEQIGIRDNFFELGGHSLLATRIVSRLRQELNVPLALRAIFEHPTIEALAMVVAGLQISAAGGEAPSPVDAGDQTPESVDQLIAGIDSLSDDKVSSLLSQLFGSEGTGQ